MFNKLYLMILCAFNTTHEQICRLNTRSDFGEPLPVILRNGQLLEPDDKYGNIELRSGETLTLSCEGTGSLLHPNAIRQVTTASITCEAGKSFKNDDWLNAPAPFYQFRCQEPPSYRSIRTNRTCFDGNPIIEVGYHVDHNFYPLYESCFDDRELKAVYSKYTQKPYNAMFQQRVDRPYFIAGDNYRLIPVETLFSPRGQKAAVARIVGQNIIDTYITQSQLLSRGHLAAKTDFVFAFSERATFHYVNCAPQWTGFNGGNWNTLEVDLRNHIHAAGYNTTIYTGTYDVASLLTQFGRRENLYLYSDENENPVIPIPQYFYKVVYEPNTQRGIAFVGINNPYYTPKEARALFFCEDLCRGKENFNWLTWHPDNAVEGYTFCCTVPNFRDVVKHLPEFEVSGILT